MNTLSSLLNWIGTTIGANPNTLATSSKTLVGAINEISSNVASVVYPVGCYYWTSVAPDNFDPNTVFGGTWEQMDEGMTLVSAGETYTISVGVHKDGGSKDATLPAHGHYIAPLGVPINKAANSSGSGGKDLYYWNGGIADALQVPAHYTDIAGRSATDANMMPYKNAYCWHRIA